MKIACVLILAFALLMVSHVTVEAAEIKREVAQRLNKAEADRFLNDEMHKIVKRESETESAESGEEESE